MRTDDELRAWRDAAQSGGLPAPHRERWQALRAGVVNLWEFEAVEYWYADGWVQLMGRNEAGKSSLMALTTLIPWLADTSSDKIDTLGRSGKQFAYYVRPTGTDGDRRTPSVRALGYGEREALKRLAWDWRAEALPGHAAARLMPPVPRVPAAALCSTPKAPAWRVPPVSWAWTSSTRRKWSSLWPAVPRRTRS